MPPVNTYLIFDGNCEQAFTFINQSLEESSSVGRFDEMQNNDVPISAEDKNKIMHISLPISKEIYG
ncbi:MAG: hypothetical protein JXQ90_13870 [Cyclobacteriaceae bacterium]